jgi:DnaJ domain/Protein of unknown function (DUF1232)
MKILLSLLAVLYVLSPYDLIPERLLGLRGLLDDAVVLWLMWRYFKIFKRPPGGFDWRAPGQERTQSDYQEDTHNQSDTHTHHTPEKNPYDILGVSRNASSEEIRAAYMNLANKYHPDKVEHLGDEFKRMAEDRFKEIQEAYQKIRGK